MSSQRTTWFKSSYSGQNGECIEVRRGTAGFEVRDSKNPRGAVVGVDAVAWLSFLAGVERVVPRGS
ncbi:DUF397 domain-containing protein [Streptomyces sp. NRRL WC-3618]|uniref:DUF397 domain-containing protein n=1 Tax=Streptomyces sp. NRRL WC-3618 TaxID=1519490 RepID=UPI00099CB0C4|nr:DUF397 domain-containing protein [Streptomyces sp. NRRL WC-3618]